jgi:hypothetical protein
MANGMRPTGLSPDRVRRVLCLRSDNHAWRLGRSDFIQNAVAERVNQTRLVAVSAVRTPDLALDVQRGSIPGQPGAKGPKAMTNEGRDGRSPRGTAAAADTATRDRATIRQGLASLEGVISRVWCHRQTIVRDRDSCRSVPVGVRSQPRWSLSRLDQIGSSPQLRDLGRDLAAFH